MPEISRFEGLIIKMIYLDNEKHHQLHVHVYCNEYEASVSITGEILSGSLPIKKFNILKAWLIIHEDELYRAWNKAVQGISIEPIKPLE